MRVTDLQVCFVYQQSCDLEILRKVLTFEVLIAEFACSTWVFSRFTTTR